MLCYQCGDPAKYFSGYQDNAGNWVTAQPNTYAIRYWCDYHGPLPYIGISK